MTINELEFLHESNLIESEPSGVALLDSAKAWEWLFMLAEDETDLKVSDILSVHSMLMERLNPGIAGKIRDIDVWVGGKPGANPASLRYKLDDLVKVVPKTWKEIKKWHVDFEGIHPFEDGNGRTGRILMNWQRVQNKLPIKIIHHGDEQFRYYEWFR